jgi:hypothetical protein
MKRSVPALDAVYRIEHRCLDDSSHPRHDERRSTGNLYGFEHRFIPLGDLVFSCVAGCGGRSEADAERDCYSDDSNADPSSVGVLQKDVFRMTVMFPFRKWDGGFAELILPGP